MVIRHWSSAFFLLAVLPAAVALINPTAFFVLMCLMTLTVTGKSLKKLVILNFASDAYICQHIGSGRPMPETKKEIRLRHAMILGMNLLMILFFIFVLFAADLLWLKCLAAVVALCWTVDLGRTAFRFWRGEVRNREWGWKDTAAECFIWFQNIASVVLVVCAFSFMFFI